MHFPMTRLVQCLQCTDEVLVVPFALYVTSWVKPHTQLKVANVKPRLDPLPVTKCIGNPRPANLLGPFAPNVHAREFKLRLGFSSYDEQMLRNWHRQ